MAKTIQKSWNWTAVALWSVFAAVLFGLDQLTKSWIQGQLIVGDSKPITSFFNLVVAYNSGAAFSFLADAGGWQRYFFTLLAIVACSVICVLIAKKSTDKLLCLGLAMVMSGAVGNAWDRATLGIVVDFLDFHAFGYHWPAFNFADICICVGAFFVVLDELFFSGKK